MIAEVLLAMALVSAPFAPLSYDELSACRERPFFGSCSQAIVANYCETKARNGLARDNAKDCAPAALRLWHRCSMLPAGDPARSFCDLRTNDQLDVLKPVSQQCSLLKDSSPARTACEKDGPKDADAVIADMRKLTESEVQRLQLLKKPVHRFSPQAVGYTQQLFVAVTEFCVERASEEVALFFQEQLAKDLCKGKQREVANRLFRRTCAILKPAGTEDANPSLIGLGKALRGDLEDLPRTFPGLVFEKASTPELRAVGCFVSLAGPSVPAFFAGGVASGLHAFAHAPLAANCSGDYGDKPNPWEQMQLTVAAAAELLRRSLEIEASGRKLTNADYNFLISELSGTVDDHLLEPVQQRLMIIDRVVARSAEARAKHSFESTARLAEAFFELLGSLAEATSDETIKKRAADLHGVAAAFAAVAAREYVTAVVQLLSLDAMNEAIAEMEDDNAREVIATVRRHGVVVASLAEAQNAEQMKAVLRHAAAPAGSWREFRKRSWAGFIGGVLGFGGGLEVPLKKGEAGAVVGPMLPIGLEIGRPLIGNWSFNLLVPVIDLGSLASVRVSEAATGDKPEDGQAKQDPESKLVSVLAPGLFLELGLGNSPFVAALGAQYAPASRKYYACSGLDCSAQTQQAFRFQAFLAIDLPIYPVF